MRINKNILIITILISACNNNDTVPRAQYDEIIAEYQELKEVTAATQASYIRQSEQVDSILNALSQISVQTSDIRLDVENGTSRLTQVQQIEASIDDIREKIKNLEEIASHNTGLKKIISGLKKVVEEKDEEIKQLKKQISEKDRKIIEQDATIVKQSGTINTQMQTILEQKTRLEQAVEKQAIMLYNAGLAFESLGDDTPEIKRKKDKAKVENLTKEMYENALMYYSEAFQTGYQDAAPRVTAVKRKLSLL